MKPYKIINKLIEKYEAHKSKKLANRVNREIARQEREDNTPKYAVKDLYVGKIIYLKDTWYTPKDDIVHWEFVTMKDFAILTKNDYGNYHHFISGINMKTRSQADKSEYAVKDIKPFEYSCQDQMSMLQLTSESKLSKNQIIQLEEAINNKFYSYQDTNNIFFTKEECENENTRTN